MGPVLCKSSGCNPSYEELKLSMKAAYTEYVMTLSIHAPKQQQQ